MKKEVSPLVAIAALVVFLGVAAFVYLRAERRTAPPVAGNSGGGGMPPQVSAEIKRRLDSVKTTKP